MMGSATLLPPVNRAWPPDPFDAPAYYAGVTLRRIVAYFVDFWIMVALLLVLHFAVGIATILTFGLLGPLHFLLVPLVVMLLYHILQIASPYAATLGMRLCGLRAWSVLGDRPTPAQAAIHGVCFYGSVGISGGLLLIVALFNRHRRTLHDFLAGVVVLRDVS